MAQHINTNQLHQMAQIPMLQAAGLNLTILNNQQHHLSQFAQPGHQGMYQIVQQVQPGPGQVQLQNVVHQQQHQFNNIHHMQQQQHLQQQQHIIVQPQHQQQIQQHQMQQNHQQMQHQQIQQHQNDNVQLTKSGKKKKPKTNKDGVPAPKRATTAYINFTQWYREEMKKSGRTVPKIGEFGKECAGKWNSMSDEEKKPFTVEAEKDRERYRREMEVFKPSRDANKPKRPGTAFMLFMVDFRKELAGKEPEGGVAALAKLGGERWRNMTEEEKKPYCEKQNECKIVYEQAMEEYRKSTGQSQGIVNPDLMKDLKPEVSDSDTSEQLNNSLSNSNISNNNGNSVDQDQLNKQHQEDQQLQNHNSQSPGSTSVSPRNQNTMSPDPSQQQQQSSIPSIATTISLQSQSFYTPTNSFISTNFLEQQHEDASYSQTIDQQIDQQLHDGQQVQDQQDNSYLQNGGQTYQNQSHYTWN